MDYEGLLSQKRAEENTYRSGWDPIGSPTGLSRSTGLGGFNLGGGPYMGNGLSSVESSLQRLDSYTTPSFSTDAGDLFTGGASSFGGGPSSFTAGGVDGMSNGNNMPGNAGDPGAQRRQMQANYRQELIRQAQEDRARKLAEKQREQEEAESGIFTIHKPYELQAPNNNRRRRSVVNAYGDEFAQQLEERRQRQERGRNNLLAFKQQDQQKRDSGFQYGDVTAQGGRGGSRPHVSETSFDRAQRSQSNSMQAELQQQIADKKRREAERKQQEAEEDAALNARLEEQQKKMREDLQREKEARERKERSRLERQHVIEEQQRRALEQAEQLRKEARDRKLSTAAAAPASSWDTWTDDRPAGSKQSSEDQWTQQKAADDPWDKPAEDVWAQQKPESPLKELWNDPPRQETPPAPVTLIHHPTGQPVNFRNEQIQQNQCSDSSSPPIPTLQNVVRKAPSDLPDVDYTHQVSSPPIPTLINRKQPGVTDSQSIHARDGHAGEARNTSPPIPTLDRSRQRADASQQPYDVTAHASVGSQRHLQPPSPVPHRLESSGAQARSQASSSASMNADNTETFSRPQQSPPIPALLHRPAPSRRQLTARGRSPPLPPLTHRVPSPGGDAGVGHCDAHFQPARPRPAPRRRSIHTSRPSRAETPSPVASVLSESLTPREHVRDTPDRIGSADVEERQGRGRGSVIDNASIFSGKDSKNGSKTCDVVRDKSLRPTIHERQQSVESTRSNTPVNDDRFNQTRFKLREYPQAANATTTGTSGRNESTSAVRKTSFVVVEQPMDEANVPKRSRTFISESPNRATCSISPSPKTWSIDVSTISPRCNTSASPERARTPAPNSCRRAHEKSWSDTFTRSGKPRKLSTSQGQTIQTSIERDQVPDCQKSRIPVSVRSSNARQLETIHRTTAAGSPRRQRAIAGEAVATPGGNSIDLEPAQNSATSHFHLNISSSRREKFRLSPRRAFHSSPQGPSHSSPQETSHVSPRGMFHSSLQGPSHSSPQEKPHLSPREILHLSPRETLHLSPRETRHSSPRETPQVSPRRPERRRSLIPRPCSTSTTKTATVCSSPGSSSESDLTFVVHEDCGELDLQAETVPGLPKAPRESNRSNVLKKRPKSVTEVSSDDENVCQAWCISASAIGPRSPLGNGSQQRAGTPEFAAEYPTSNSAGFPPAVDVRCQRHTVNSDSDQWRKRASPRAMPRNKFLVAPQPAVRSPRRLPVLASTQAQSPVPTPRLSLAGEVPQTRSERPGLRRLQRTRREIEDQHDAFSLKLARNDSALNSGATYASPFPTSSPTPSFLRRRCRGVPPDIDTRSSALHSPDSDEAVS